MNDNVKMFNLNSSSIAACGYDAKTKVLTVEFARGKTYRYADVPQAVFEDLKDAESPGKYFQSYVKNVYEFESE